MSEEIEYLKNRINLLENKLNYYENECNVNTNDSVVNGLHLSEYKRYGRQMVLNGIGLPGQLKLKNATILIIGAGGLGCPSSQYLAASGIGKLVIVDNDLIEISNLHRQILHNDRKIGMYKAESIKQSINELNSNVEVETILESFNNLNAQSIIENYSPDVVLDCSDNPSTRYLISDTVVIHNRQSIRRASLVSAAATGFEGQIMTLCYNDEAPCYRCIVPKPPPKQAITSCAEDGILGLVTGMLGTMQAMEALKLITGLHSYEPSLTIYSTLSKVPFRTMRMRGKKEGCFVDQIKDVKEVDYIQFCGGSECEYVELNDENDMSMEDYVKVANDKDIIIDVRPKIEFGICNIENSQNIPITSLLKDGYNVDESDLNDKPIYIICRRGNDSRIATKFIKDKNQDKKFKIINLRGGMERYSKLKNFIIY